MARVRDGIAGPVYDSTEKSLSGEVSTSEQVTSEIENDGDAADLVPTEPAGPTEPAARDVAANDTTKESAEIEKAMEEPRDGDEASPKGTAEIEKAMEEPRVGDEASPKGTAEIEEDQTGTTLKPLIDAVIQQFEEAKDGNGEELEEEEMVNTIPKEGVENVNRQDTYEAEDDEVSVKETEEDEAGNDGLEDDDLDSQPLPQQTMHFPFSEYGKVCKISSRCQVTQTIELIERKFKEEAVCEDSLLEEAWFVVNGVPIRYSIKEHALLSGFDCHSYPKEMNTMGNINFVKRIFKKESGIKVVDVLAKCSKMKHGSDRLKLVLLYFLVKVVKAGAKNDGNIEEFLLRIVGDLNACETFPWGRYTFLECMAGIRKMMKNMNGFVKPKAQPCFSGFIVPLEILPYEAIPQLGLKFRVHVRSALSDCPRMCKHKFKECSMKGVPLEVIYKELGNTKDFPSILVPAYHEKYLLKDLLDDDVDDDCGPIDIVIDSWRERLLVENSRIWWKGMCEMDISSRCIVNEISDEEVHEIENEIQFVASITSLTQMMTKGFDETKDKIDAIDVRVQSIKLFVADLKEREHGKQTEEASQHGHARDDDVLFASPDGYVTTGNKQQRDILISEHSPEVAENSNKETNTTEKEVKGKAKKNGGGKKKQEVPPVIETGKKRTRGASRLITSPFVADDKKRKRMRKAD
ncbi:putative protein [Arabidopsis thaliana]|uniref:Uncharacterized protein F18N11.140 n=1 Tax=Arabidopsis thaliana TaxID=3702 RepID=Q9M3E0_ARATH|nr:putative protein [Arabidopsis thaliana]